MRVKVRTVLTIVIPVLLAATAPAPTHARDAAGRISGVVINGLTGQPVRGASLEVLGEGVTATSDIGGGFSADVPAGTHVVSVTLVGFETSIVEGVEVGAGAVADFAVVLMPAADAPPGLIEEATGEGGAGTFTEEIEVTVEAVRSTETALLSERRNAAQISDLIGTEEIKKNTGSDAAGVLKRVTGISVQDNKYVYVRGLGERYSNTTLNGAKVPSTEFERKVVPLDLFPAGLLEKVRVSKSYSVDKPGDFAAGFVELETLDFPARQQASVGFSLGWNSVSTGEPFSEYGGGLDTFGGGGQPAPAGLPSEPLVRVSPITGEGFTPAELEAIGESLLGRWTGTPAGDAPLNQGFSASYGNTFGALGLVVSGTYSHDFTSYDEEQNYYRVGSGSEPVLLNDYDFDVNQEKVKQGLVANAAYRLSSNHHVKLRTLATTVSTAESRTQEGYVDDYGAPIRDDKLEYTEQEVASFQLSGEHFFELGPMGSLLEWRGGHSTADTFQDLRLTNYADRSGDGVYVLTDNAQSGFIYYNDLSDEVSDGGLSWTTFLSGDGSFGEVEAGVAVSESRRDFAGRRLRFQPRRTAGIDLTAPPEEIFVPENIGSNGFEIEEITRPTDTYQGDQSVDAAYAQLDYSWSRLRVVGGARYEASDMEVATLDRYNPEHEPVVTLLSARDWLPSLSLVYRLGAEQNLRFSGSQTVNRPEFRELAPYRFTSIVGGYEVTGNPDLVSATIRSYDARWEWFPGPSDVVAVSAFYKSFDDPIESVLVSAVIDTLTYRNAAEATNRGFELELRRGLGTLGAAFEPFSVGLNYSWIDSEIAIPEGSILTNDARPLVGQPDHVANLVLEWLPTTAATSVRLLYNHAGDKVAIAGSYGLPDVVEQARGTVDLAVRQGLSLFGADWTLKLSGENLTGEEVEFLQGGALWRRFNPGTRVGLSVSLNL